MWHLQWRHHWGNLLVELVRQKIPIIQLKPSETMTLIETERDFWPPIAFNFSKSGRSSLHLQALWHMVLRECFRHVDPTQKPKGPTNNKCQKCHWRCSWTRFHLGAISKAFIQCSRTWLTRSRREQKKTPPESLSGWGWCNHWVKTDG